MTIVISLNNRAHHQDQNGFVLILVVWVLAGLSLMVAFMASQLDDLQTLAFNNETLVQQRLDSLGVQSTALYLASTRTYSYAGLRTKPYVPIIGAAIDLIDTDYFADRGDELRLDNRVYMTSSGYQLQLQDAGSLVSLRSDGFNALRNLLESYDLDRSRVEQLVASLEDYIDRDEFASLNGAERSQYVRRELQPPTNRFLVSPWQLNNVLGWRELLNEHPSILDEVTIYVADRENYNSMTERAITAVTPNSADEAKRIVSHRGNASFRRLNEVNEVSGNLYSRDAFSITFVPSRYIRMTLTHPDQRKAQLIGITLTPDSNLAPWEIDYSVTRPSSRQIATDASNETGRLEPTTPPTTLL